MSGAEKELARLLTAAETAAPVEAVDVVAEHLRQRFGATAVSFLVVDLTGRAVRRLFTAAEVDGGPRSDWIDLYGSDYGEVIRTQRFHRQPIARGERIIAPVTNRGDAIGLLEVLLPATPTAEDLEALGEAAHALAYLVIANGRFTDLYTWGKRSRPPTLAAEIQYQLLPLSLSCEAAEFALSGSLEPSENLSGDTFDYAVGRDLLQLSVTDTMGHDIQASLSATVLLGALRGARRAGASLREQARLADQALASHDHGHATGQLLHLHLHTGRATLVNAGHPWPLRLRDGVAEEVSCLVDRPFGLGLSPTTVYRVQDIDVLPGDRLLMISDGALEKGAEKVDLLAMLWDTRHLHPREAALAMTAAVRDAYKGELQDDATVMCLDWHGPQESQRDVSFGADVRQASPSRRRQP